MLTLLYYSPWQNSKVTDTKRQKLEVSCPHLLGKKKKELLSPQYVLLLEASTVAVHVQNEACQGNSAEVLLLY